MFSFFGKLEVKCLYQGHLIDVESNPGKVAEENEKGGGPGEDPTSIAFVKD